MARQQEEDEIVGELLKNGREVMIDWLPAGDTARSVEDKASAK